MSRVSFVMGATASGKTHFIKKCFKNKDVTILNAYDYQIQVYDEEGYGDSIPIEEQKRCLIIANDRLIKDVIKTVKTGKDIVIENTFFKAKRRISYIDEIRKNGDVKIDVYVMSPGDDLWKSNIKKREFTDDLDYFKSMAENIEFPNPSEGFDAIYEVTDSGCQKRMDEPRLEIVDVARKELQEEAESFHEVIERKEQEKQLLESMNTRPFWHYCEVCGKKEYITAEQAFNNGWDYPPHIGVFGVLSQRTCGDCPITSTLWFRMMQKKREETFDASALTPEEVRFVERVKGEPASLLEEELE